MPINKEYVPIDNKPTIKPRTVTGIFTRYIAKTLPLAFDESMSYYECLCALLEYINTKVIPALDNNAAGLLELQEFYEELQTYVNDYFKNLDVQEEINNKLDDMAESGQLTDIIAQYLGLAGMIAFDTVADMKEAQNLVNGSKCHTLGYHSVNDGGNGVYKIRTITNDDVIDETSIIAVYDDLLVAELIIDNAINTKQFGCYGDGIHDDTLSIQNAINYAVDHNGELHFDNGSYIISDTLTIPDMKTIKIYGDFDMGGTIDNLTYGSEIKQTGENKIIFNFLGSNYRSRISCLRFSTNKSSGNTGIKANTLLGEFTIEKISFDRNFDKCIDLTRAGIGTISNCVFSGNNIGINCVQCSSIQFLYNNFANNTINIKIGIIDGCKFDSNWFEAAGTGHNDDIGLLFQAPSIVHWCDFTNNNFNMLNKAIVFDGITNITEPMSFNMLWFENNRVSSASPVIIDMKDTNNNVNRNGSNMFRIIWTRCVFNNVTSGQVFSIDYDALGLNNGMRVNDCMGYTGYLSGDATMFTNGQTNTAVTNSSALGFTTNGSYHLEPAVHYSIIKNNSIHSDSVHRIFIRNNNGVDNKILLGQKGESSERPTQYNNVGDIYYDTTLHKPLWWSGSAWLDSTGNVA